MDFHKSLAGMIVALVGVVLGVLGTMFVLSGLADGARVNVLFIIVPIVLVVGGLVAFVGALRPLKMRIDERGILLQHKATKVALAWQYIANVTVEELPKPKGESGTATYLTVWTHGGVNPGVPQERMIERNGWVGYRLIDISDLREDKEKLGAALTHYAAPLFR